MNILNALEKTIDTLKKYNDSRYVRYEEINSNNYKTPQDYGADGRGFSDDTNAINQAIEENNIIYFPPGIYNITSPILVSSAGKTIYGTRDTKIIAKNCAGFLISNSNNIELRDLQIIGNNTSNHGVIISGGGYKNSFTNLSISNFKGDGFHTNWFDAGFGVSVIEKCSFKNCGNGIMCLSDAIDQRNNITITNNLFGQITSSAIRITGCGIIIEGNNIENCEYGIKIDNWNEAPDRDNTGYCGSLAIRIVGNYIENATKAFASFSHNLRKATDTSLRKDGMLDGIVFENNYCFINNNVTLSDSYAEIEFTSYVNDSEASVNNLIEDLTFAGNVFSTERTPTPILINGNNLLSQSCSFTISKLSKGECLNMGAANIIRVSNT